MSQKKSVADRHRAELIEQLRSEGIVSEEVLEAMGQVPRHEFLDAAVSRRMDRAYHNVALPIGYRQTISQPAVVARMTQELLQPTVPERVLEVGTGSGYQSAVLSLLVKRVYSIERVPQLHAQATKLLHRLGYRNVRTRLGDGYRGWPQHGPYQGIIVTAAAAEYPRELEKQLVLGGRMLIPEGREGEIQSLVRYDRTEQGMERRELMKVLFVPLVAESE